MLAFSNCPLDPLLGSGQTRLAWTEGLRARGHSVEVWDSEALLGKASPARGRRWRLGWNAWRRLRAVDLNEVDLIEFYGAEFWLATWWFSRLPRRRRPLLVAHSDGLEPAYVGRLVACGAEQVAHDPLRRVQFRASRLAFTRSDAFVTASEADRQYALEHGFWRAEQMAIVRIGLNERFLREPAPAVDAPGREERVTFLGSWISGKGVRWVVEVMERLWATRPNLRLSLLGVGGGESEVRAAFSPEVQPRLEVQSRLSPDAIAEVLAKTKVLFLPTEYEGFGLATAEAMACGCAVVTTPTGFGAELVDGEEALICPFGDVGAMQGAIGRLLDDDALRMRIAAAGQRRARTLRWETSVARLEETYLRWVAEHRRAQAS